MYGHLLPHTSHTQRTFDQLLSLALSLSLSLLPPLPHLLIELLFPIVVSYTVSLWQCFIT